MTVRPIVFLTALACTFVLAREAAAQWSIHDNNWRQRDRSEQVAKAQGPRPHFAMELRFGPYYPQVDSHPNLRGATPYKDVFDDDPQFYIGTEIDWQAFRIPFVGPIGPGFGIGYTKTSTNALISAPGKGLGNCHSGIDGCHSEEETSLLIIPMHLSIVLRIDEPFYRWRIPVVPYGKIGMAMGMWFAGTSTEKTYERNGKTFDPEGVTWGNHFALGGMFNLNWLDPASVARARSTGDAANFYVFGEWMNFVLNGLGSRPQLRVGSSTWVVGITVEM